MRMERVMNFKEEQKEKVEKIEAILREYLPEANGYQSVIMEAMEYSLMAGGKRLRPMLMMETYRLFGCSRKDCSNHHSRLDQCACLQSENKVKNFLINLMSGFFHIYNLSTDHTIDSCLSCQNSQRLSDSKAFLWKLLKCLACCLKCIV